MSGGLLLGIAAVGVGWAWVCRGHGSNPAPSQPGNTVVDDADKRIVAEEIPQATTGVAAIKAAVDTESHAPVIGDTAVAGADGGQVLPIERQPEGAINIDPDKSTGGADPSTQRTRLHDNQGDDTPPAIIQADTQSVILSTRFGVCGAEGMTPAQISKAHEESAIWSNEVF